MNNGRKIEKLVRLIQEALKDVPNTQIFSNYKISNESGRKREIDILLKTNINSFEIKIAIECKDYKSAISVEKIEAFNSKCQRIQGISKKIFVSTNGYQADASDAAKYFDIELFNLSEINLQDIIQWFQIKQLKARYLLKPPHQIRIEAEQNELDKIVQENEIIINFYDNSPSVSLSVFLWNSVVCKNQQELKAMMLLDFMKYNSNLNYQTVFPYTLDCSGIYIEGENNKKLNVSRIESVIVGWLEEQPVKIIDARNYQKSNNVSVANTITIDADRNEVTDIVYTKENNLKIFHTNETGQIMQLETLFEYDPKTDKFIDLMKKNKG